MIALTTTLIFAGVSSSGIDKKVDAIASVSADAFIFVEKGKPLKKVYVSWDMVQAPALSKNDLSIIAEINHISAFCSISRRNTLTDCKIAESTVETKKASKIYTKVLENVRANSCANTPCYHVKVAVRLSLLVDRASAKPTNYCVAPFCMPGPRLPMPPGNINLGRAENN